MIPKLFISVVILLNACKHITCGSPTVRGYCGDPGMPFRAQVSPTQNIYSEDETVVYKCDDYISLKQYRKCVKGQWVGENARCGNAFRDNDLRYAKIYDKTNGELIKHYNTSALEVFNKFGNSFIAERYAQPLRAFGSQSYRIELYVSYPEMFQLVRISLSAVNQLVDERIRRTKFNITNVMVSPYRKCRLYTHSSVSPWLNNSTRYDFWFICESIDDKSLENELKNKSNSVVIETEASDVMDLDLATFILAHQYTNNGNAREPICGTPEVPIGLDTHVINHHTRYAFKCAPGFAPADKTQRDSADNDLVCRTDMTWRGSLPRCLPLKTCKRFEANEKLLTEVFLYEKVYYYNTSVWFAIEDTKAHFRCKDETLIFIGKEYRVCDKDGQWSDSLPNCLDPAKGFTNSESKLTITTISIIVLLSLVLIFGLFAFSVFCIIRVKKLRRNNDFELRQSNIYDDYSFQGLEAKNMEETYETVYDQESRYAVARNLAPPVYTQMTGGQSFKYNFNDKNVYDDCIDYDLQHNPNAGAFDESYVQMNRK